MGLETLLEAAKFLEYKAEVEARGEKGLFPALPSNSSSSALLLASSTHQNGYTNNHHPVIQNGNGGGAYVPSSYPHHYQKGGNGTTLPRVPEPVNGFKLSGSAPGSDHSYRRGHLSHSPTYEFNGGTNRAKGRNSSSSSSSSSVVSVTSRNSGTREVHNKLEKNRRAHLKECFEMLKGQLPSFEDRKISNLAILRSSLRYIQTLKRKERDFEHEMERLAREKIALQQRLSTLKKDMLGKWDQLDWRAIVPEDLDMDLEPDAIPIDYGRKGGRKNASSPAEANQPPKQESDEGDEDSSNDSHHLNNHGYPISLALNNEDRINGKSNSKHYEQINGVNGMSNSSSSSGAISLVTATKLSSSPLAAITVEKTANSPVGGASFVNNFSSNSPIQKGFSVLNNTTVNAGVELGQYYEEEKMCK